MADKLFIAAFCKQTGLSKRNLAAFVGTDQSALSRFETGSRNLSPDALVMLATLYKKASTIKAEIQARPALADKKFCKEQIRWCKVQCLPLQKKLTGIIENYRQASTALLLLDTISKETSTFSEKKKRWMEEQRYQAHQKLKKNDWMAQQKLTLQIQLLETEAAFWQAIAS
jgi:transcriptional regulator with XRE-family HTH domain